MKRNKYIEHTQLLIIFLLISSLISSAQEQYLSGYQETTAGTNFSYHSPYSHNDGCLLSRANKDFPAIEWETEMVPLSYQEESISFIWLYGMDVLPESQEFELSVNGEYLLTFASPTHNEEDIWKVNGKDGAEIVFNRALIDKHGDQMGYAVLTLPTTMIKKGEATSIKVDGINNQSNAWYMTFKLPLKSEYSVSQIKSVAKTEGELFHLIRFNIVHLGQPINASLSVDENTKVIPLKTGLNEVDFLVPKVEEATLINTQVIIDSRVEEKQINLEPVKEWTIYLVQHSHTDIGYTRAQSEILAEQLRYIDDALDYCDQTDHYPKDAQFRWTCEAAWTIREYLNSRPPQQIERLLQRIKEGRIEVTAMFFNYSEIVDETALVMQMQTLKLFKEYGIEVNTAMQNDVNGMAWSMIDLYQETGVKFVSMGQHGHRARIPFDKPTSFWWESPSGNKLLAYRSEHYMHGNSLSLTNGNRDEFAKNLSKYLGGLEDKNYPFDRIAFQFSGYITDNSPPSTKACDMVKEWNENYEWPKLKLSIASEFMFYLEENEGDQLATQKVAWPDWWTDGFGSAMNETKTSRVTHSNMIATMGLFSMAQANGAKVSEGMLKEINRCYDNLLFYDEHTFGAAESISEPMSENSVNQWQQKSSYVWSANQQSNLLLEKAMGLIEPHIKKTEESSITVFNTLNWKRSGVVEVFIDHDILPIDKSYQIIDEKGNPVPAQIIRSRNEGSYWALWINDAPAMGYTTYKILVSDAPLIPLQQGLEIAETFENIFYKINLDLKESGIISLIDKETNKELIDPDSEYKLGSLINERLDNRTDLERLTHQNRDTVYRPLNREMTQLSDFKMVKAKDGKIWKSVFFHGNLPDCASSKGVTVELRLYHHTKKIELLYNMTKLANTDPEGLYVAFPFSNKDNGELAFEVQGGVVYPGQNQLEGTASDWNTIQNFATVKSDDSQIVFCSNDIPLVQFGEINTGRYYYKHVPQNSHIYSWVLNNYWTTNFRASQEGELKWKYQITSSDDPSLSFAGRFGVENRVPMIGRANFGNSVQDVPMSKSIIDLNSPDNLLLINSRPSSNGNGILLHLRETEGNQAKLDIDSLLQNPNIISVSEVNVLGEKIKTIEGSCLIDSFETKFLLLEISM